MVSSLCDTGNQGDTVQRGILSRWNAERGFGFITPERANADDVFIHISSLKHMARPPQAGDIILFQIDMSADGKPRAGLARIEGVPVKTPPQRQKQLSQSRFTPGSLLKLVGILGLIVFVMPNIYPLFHNLQSSTPGYELPASTNEAFPVKQITGFRCEGKTHCNQMRSCEEATFYIENCPGTEMDGDNDGIPCERQWCRH
ncbi:excalibur calcium-binding domain-containing protein [Shewanella sp.]|uniref:excalibur calcium-binding domain-containing protein n=1 Tax=Shewanella sp. TaxID=50422 RepID=UPI00356A3B46